MHNDHYTQLTLNLLMLFIGDKLVHCLCDNCCVSCIDPKSYCGDVLGCLNRSVWKP